MNPRQRRGVLLISVAVIAAVAVAVTVLRYLEDVRSELGPMVTLVATANDLTAYSPITIDDLATAEVPERWAPSNTFSSPEEVLGLVASADVPAGTLMTHGLVRERPAVQPGQREIAIMVDAETGVAGKIRSGDIVDIFATFDHEVVGSSVRIVVQRARILEVGTPVTEEGGSGGFSGSSRVPITFLLSVEDASTLAYVESYANSVRLALRSQLDDTLLGDDETVFIPGPDDLGRVGSPLPLGQDPLPQQQEPADDAPAQDLDAPGPDDDTNGDQEVES